MKHQNHGADSVLLTRWSRMFPSWFEVKPVQKVLVLSEPGSQLTLSTCFLQVFDDLQKMLSVATEPADPSRTGAGFPSSPVVQFAMGACVALATVGMGLYIL